MTCDVCGDLPSFCPQCRGQTFEMLRDRVAELETALRGLLTYTDDMVAGDGMPDSPEQTAARKALGDP